MKRKARIPRRGVSPGGFAFLGGLFLIGALAAGGCTEPLVAQSTLRPPTAFAGGHLAMETLAAMARAYGRDPRGIFVRTWNTGGINAAYTEWGILYGFPSLIAIPPGCHEYTVGTSAGREGESAGPREYIQATCPTFLVSRRLLQTNDPVLIRSILAHEFAHYLASHDTKRQSVEPLAALFDLTVRAVLGAPAANAVMSGIVAGYSRMQEFEADALAIEVLGRLGDPHPKETYLAVLLRLDEESDEGPANAPSWPRTHPAIDERIAKLEGTLGDHPSAKPSSIRMPPGTIQLQ